MGRIFIVEGPDGAGKTTLCDKLRQKFPDSIYRHTGPPEFGQDLLHDYAKILYMASLRLGTTIIDRLHLGESIYGPIFRKNDLLGEEGQTLLKRMISGYGAVEVICLPPYSVALGNWKKNHGRELVQDELLYQDIYGGYMEASRRRGFYYDYTLGLDELAIKSILELGKYSLPAGTIGSVTPKFLFIGDQANHTDLDAPFISLTGSSHYLYECLREAGYKEDEMAFVNAHTIAKRRVDLRSAWLDLGKPVAVCLGGRALAAFGSNGGANAIPFFHPAYWKRFKSSRRHEYVDNLKHIREAYVHSPK